MSTISLLMRKAASALLLFIFLSFFAGFFNLQQLQAATADQGRETTAREILMAEKEGKNNLGYTVAKAYSTILNMTALQTGNCPEGLEEACTDSEVLADGSVVNFAGGLVASLFIPPASSEEYIADLFQDMNIIAEPAYAQGLGFSALTPILEIWKLFRNIAYVFFVIIFLFIGFAIMFRQNLGGQTAVTIQQALPRVIVALLAVTFSYAIAGLLIDVMYLMMFFLISIFASTGLINSKFTDAASGDYLLNMDTFKVFWTFMTSGLLGDTFEVISKVVRNFLEFDGLLEDVGEGVLGALGGMLGVLIVAFALIFATFKTFFSLVKIYMEILLMIIFAPLILMLGAVNANAFGNWFKGLFVNLMVFPALLVFIMVGMMLLNETPEGGAAPVRGGFSPPFVQGGAQADVVGAIAAIATIMLLPEVVGIMQKYRPASIFDDLGNKAWGNTMAGWSGNKYLPGVSQLPSKIANANPYNFGFGEDPAGYRTQGKETAIERILIGSREHRRKEFELQRQAAALGQTGYQLRPGGLRAALEGRRQKKQVQETTQGGAGSQSEENL